MSGFSADWLELREPFDAAARSAALIAELRRHVALGTQAAPLPIVDLGAGAGSNLRYLAPRLGGVQQWRLVDHDRQLLEAAALTTRAWAEARGAVVRGRTPFTIHAADFSAEVHCERRDLSAHPVTIPLGDLELPTGVLVTAAALLDLVSSDWLGIFALRCQQARASVCFALTYDGRTVCTPAEPEDGEVLTLFNRHQLLDKGFGPALGPHAAHEVQRALAAWGYRFAIQESDWLIERADGAMQTALLDGWLGAALEIAPERRTVLTDWHGRRCAHVAAGHSRLRVGHVDLIGWL